MGNAKFCLSGRCNNCPACLPDLLLDHFDFYFSAFWSVLAEEFGDMTVSDEELERGVTFCFEHRVRIAHVTEACRDRRSRPALRDADDEGKFRYVMKRLRNFVGAEQVIPRVSGTPWCLTEDEALLRAMDRLSLQEAAEALGCSTGAALGRAQRLMLWGAFPAVWLVRWELEWAEERGMWPIASVFDLGSPAP